MRRISLLVLCIGFIVSAARAQVLPANEIQDPQLRSLEERNIDDLKQLGAQIEKLPTDYPFYLSRKLDLDLSKQKWADQRSIQFDRYRDKIVLKITGNYYAAYSAEKMDADQRAKQTFLQIVLPILQFAVPIFENNSSVQAYALEISHHVVGKVRGVGMERAENLVVIIPQAAAVKLVSAKDDTERQAAIMRGEVFLNAKATTIWLSAEGPQLAQETPPDDPATAAQSATPASVEAARNNEQDIDKMPSPVRVPVLKPAKPADPPKPPRDTSPPALAALQSALKPIVDGMVKELDPQANFVSYASPSFIAFRNGVYLELSINTTLAEPPTASHYRLAALAFDDHVAHLIRPVLGYFKDDSQFDGFGFSSTLHLATKAGANANSEAVEFFFPFPALRCYERYDCTGQQLIDAGTVLINGERVSLDLQSAEASGSR